MSEHPPTCELVAERIALGEPLAELDAHVATCARCRRVAALPTSLAATGHAADPGIGFSSRVTAGAQHRLGVRRRRRVLTAALVSAAAAAALAVGVAKQAGGDDASLAYTFPIPELPKPALTPVAKHADHDDNPSQPDVDPDVRALVRLARADRAHHHTSAGWARLEKPLRPYRAVLEGKAP